MEKKGGSKKKSTPRPDEGYAWVIAVLCFSINFILIGIARSVGVLYAEMVEHYDVSRLDATMPFSVRVSVRNTLGPVIGILGQKYGIRAVTTVGGFVAGIGGILCYFAPNIIWITIFWGVIHGLGFGLSTVLHMIMINHYFDKYKASALGLGYSGDCFGTFAFPVIIESLLSTYDVRGTFLILGGIVLNVIPLALLLRKPPWLKSEKKRKIQQKATDVIKENYLKDSSSNKEQMDGYTNKAFVYSVTDMSGPKNNEIKIGSRDNLCNSVTDNLDGLPDYRKAIENSENCNPMANGNPSPVSFISKSFSIHRKSYDYNEPLRENRKRHDSLPPLSETRLSENNKQYKVLPEDVLSTVSEHHYQREDGDPAFELRGSMKKRRTSSFVAQMAQDLAHKVRSASFASQVAQDAFVSNINQETEEEEDADNLIENEQKYPDKNEGSKVGEEHVAFSKTDGVKIDIPRKLSLANLKQQQGMLKNLLRTNTKPMFILISMSMAFYAFVFVAVLTIIIDYSVDLGVSNERGKYLVIGFSITDLFGRLSFGQIIDRKLIKMKNYSGVNMLLMGLMVAIIPLNSSFAYMMACMCLYGLFQGGTAIMFPILVGTYMEKNEESIAMGCLNFYGGLLMLLLAPMIGYFRDNTGSYNGVFFITGGLVSAVGLVWLLEPLILKFQNRKLVEKDPKTYSDVNFCTRL